MEFAGMLFHFCPHCGAKGTLIVSDNCVYGCMVCLSDTIMLTMREPAIGCPALDDAKAILGADHHLMQLHEAACQTKGGV
jgi:hypothetical protein